MAPDVLNNYIGNRLFTCFGAGISYKKTAKTGDI